jgi:hypothetical protein
MPGEERIPYLSGAGRWAGEEVLGAQHRLLVGVSSLRAAFVVAKWSTLAASPFLVANSPLFVAGRPLSVLEIPVLGALCDSGREKCRKSTENAPNSKYCTQKAGLCEKAGRGEQGAGEKAALREKAAAGEKAGLPQKAAASEKARRPHRAGRREMAALRQKAGLGPS